MPIFVFNYYSLQIKLVPFLESQPATIHEKNAIKWASKLSVKKASEIEIGKESSK